ncbi:hypothetical protein COV13_02450 [Candidatus Woesearchaeota archaeon CG10_big_fil_rev_8_21_14_0_10_32_9]|nr:MAG: hypothetical protein COV13_02450 [Candidatus Woesearchaeota archaeon CG10_big_fil_rev_8_21_14_0_10_32_9]
MNKKGGMWNIVIGAFAAVLIIIIYFTIVGKTDTNTITDASNSITVNSDGDEFNNMIDPCPCGSPPNQNNKKISVDGYLYCQSGFSEEQCNKIITEQKFAGFEVKEYRGEKLCIYKKTSEMNSKCPTV